MRNGTGKELRRNRKRLRVLVVGTFPPPVCGTTVLVEQLCRELETRHDIEVTRIETRTGRTSNRFQQVLSFVRTVFSVWWKAPGVDVITQHGCTYGARFLGPILLFVARLRRKPFVFRRFAGDFDVEYHRSSPLQRYLLRWLLKADRVLLETKRLVRHFRNEFPRGRFVWYPNSRPLRGAPQSNGNAARPARRFVFLGHVMREKGILELKKAAERVAPLGVQVDLYGPRLPNISEDDLSGVENLRYRGSLDPKEVPATLAQYDVLVLPSHREGYPGGILEAYSVGLPVLATRVGGVPEIVDDGETGVLVPAGDPDRLARAMALLAESGKQMKRLREGAARKAAEFDSERWTEVFAEQCRSLAGRNLARTRSTGKTR